jgi:hypothetical protein
MNPYEAPRHDGPPAGSGGDVHLQKLLRIATAQRMVNLSILGGVAWYVVALVVRGIPILGALIIGVTWLAMIGFSIWAELKLANELHGKGVAILCAVLMFFPCLNLITLVVLNQGATGRLKQEGFKVGLLGGDPAEVEARIRAGR